MCDRTSQRRSRAARSSSSAGRVAASGCDLAPAVVVPFPRAVVELVGVVQDAAAQRRLAAGRVVLDRPGQEGVEARRSSAGPSTKSMIAFAFCAGSPRGDVDEHQPADQLGPARRQHDRRHAARATCRRSAGGLRGEPLDGDRDVARPGSPGGRCCRRASSECPWPGRSTATSGRSEGQGDRVPGVGVHRRAVEEHELRRPASAPHERAEGPAARQRDLLPSYARRPGPRQPVLGGVLVEQARTRRTRADPWLPSSRRPPAAVGSARRASRCSPSCGGSRPRPGRPACPTRSGSPRAATDGRLAASGSRGGTAPAAGATVVRPPRPGGPPATAPPLGRPDRRRVLRPRRPAPGHARRPDPRPAGAAVSIEGARAGRSCTVPHGRGPAGRRLRHGRGVPNATSAHAASRPPWAHGTTGLADQCAHLAPASSDGSAPELGDRRRCGRRRASSSCTPTTRASARQASTPTSSASPRVATCSTASGPPPSSTARASPPTRRSSSGATPRAAERRRSPPSCSPRTPPSSTSSARSPEPRPASLTDAASPGPPRPAPPPRFLPHARHRLPRRLPRTSPATCRCSRRAGKEALAQVDTRVPRRDPGPVPGPGSGDAPGRAADRSTAAGKRPAGGAQPGGDQTTTVPLFIYHGDADTSVPPQLSAELLVRYCALGVTASRAVYPGTDHISVIAAALRGHRRLPEGPVGGEPAPRSCPPRERPDVRRADVAGSPP